MSSILLLLCEIVTERKTNQAQTAWHDGLRPSGIQTSRQNHAHLQPIKILLGRCVGGLRKVRVNLSRVCRNKPLKSCVLLRQNVRNNSGDSNPIADESRAQNQTKSGENSHVMRIGLTKKAEPPPTCDVNRDSGTASANGGWLRRLVRRLLHSLSMMNCLQQGHSPRRMRRLSPPS